MSEFYHPLTHLTSRKPIMTPIMTAFSSKSAKGAHSQVLESNKYQNVCTFTCHTCISSKSAKGAHTSQSRQKVPIVASVRARRSRSETASEAEPERVRHSPIILYFYISQLELFRVLTSVYTVYCVFMISSVEVH